MNNVRTIRTTEERADAWALEFVRQYVKSQEPRRCSVKEQRPRRLAGGCLLYRFPFRKVG